MMLYFFKYFSGKTLDTGLLWIFFMNLRVNSDISFFRFGLKVNKSFKTLSAIVYLRKNPLLWRFGIVAFTAFSFNLSSTTCFSLNEKGPFKSARFSLRAFTFVSKTDSFVTSSSLEVPICDKHFPTIFIPH